MRSGERKSLGCFLRASLSLFLSLLSLLFLLSPSSSKEANTESTAFPALSLSTSTLFDSVARIVLERAG
jgi:hypothetical protein